jgi:hypothetical protein
MHWAAGRAQDPDRRVLGRLDDRQQTGAAQGDGFEEITGQQGVGLGA